MRAGYLSWPEGVVHSALLAALPARHMFLPSPRLVNALLGLFFHTIPDLARANGVG